MRGRWIRAGCWRRRCSSSCRLATWRISCDTVREALDLSAISGAYGAAQGQPPYHPGMLTALLLYGYSRGICSSRQLARACEERVDVMAVTGLNRPDFGTISAFRKRHLAARSALFVQVLRLCRAAGLVQLGQVAVDGTKLRANASKHKAISCRHMLAQEPKLAAELQAWLDRAAASSPATTARSRWTPRIRSSSPRALPPTRPPSPWRERPHRRAGAQAQATYAGHGRNHPPRRPTIALPPPKTGGRAGLRPDQPGQGLPTIPPPRPQQGRRRMGHALHRPHHPQAPQGGGVSRTLITSRTTIHPQSIMHRDHSPTGS